MTQSDMDYIGSTHDKSFEDRYSKLVFENDTGTDQAFKTLVKPRDQYNLRNWHIGEYVVEFR